MVVKGKLEEVVRMNNSSIHVWDIEKLSFCALALVMK
jgi:hypothetical protein